jgi:hypothetical protein
MTPDGKDAGRRRRRRSGAHRAHRPRTALRRTVATGSAVACIGIAYELGTPTVNALSILIPLGDGNGTNNAIQINLFEGNIFLTQLGIGRGNVSNLSTIGGVVTANGDSGEEPLGSPQRVAPKAGDGNVTQINLFSYNIVNPQIAFGGSNVSNNTTVSNVSTGNGNYSQAQAAPAGSFWTTWVNGMTGTGNTTQLSFFSGNIFNPQWSSGGTNVSNNTAVTNISAYNGNHSETALTPGGLWAAGLLGLMSGNGNTTQAAAFTSNIFNPQFSAGGGNQSFNTATTNDSTGNGNGSANVTSTAGWGLPVSFGGMGNGNTNQFATGTSNIYNSQFHFSLGVPIGPGQSVTSAEALASAVAVNPATTASSAGGAGTVGAVAFGADDISTSISRSAGATSDGSFSARVRDAVERTLGGDTGAETAGARTSSNRAGFTPYGSDQGESLADSDDRTHTFGGPSADPRQNPPDTDDHPADSGENATNSGDRPSDGGKGESGARGDQ